MKRIIVVATLAGLLSVGTAVLAAEEPASRPSLHASAGTGPATTRPLSGQALVQELLYGGDNEQNEAQEALEELSDDQAGPTVDALITALGDPHESTQSRAAKALSEIGPRAKAAVPALIKTMQGEKPPPEAAKALAEIKADPQRCVPALIHALKNGDGEMKRNAAEALGAFGSDAKEAIDSLIEALESKDERVRDNAASALGDIGPDAARAIPALVKLIPDPKKANWSDLPPVVHGLSGIGKAGLPAMIDLLKNVDSNLGSSVVQQGMEQMKGNAAGAVPTLIEMMQKEDVANQWRAISILATIGPPAKQAVPELLRIAHESTLLERDAAAYAMYSIDPTAAAAARLAKPITKYIAWIQQQRREFEAKLLSVGGGPPDGPVVLWINGDPIDFFTGGGTMMAINPWLRPGENSLTFSGMHHAPVFALISGKVGTEHHKVVAGGAFPEPGGSAAAPAMMFTADHAPAIPEREALTNLAPQVLQGEVEQYLRQISSLIAAHDGTKVAERFYAGEGVWLKSLGATDKELQEQIDEAAKGYSDPNTSAAVTDRPIQLLIGQHALMAFVEMPTQGKNAAPLITLKNGKKETGPTFLLFARMHGKLVIWSTSSGVTMSLSQGE